ncbi:MAG: ExeA family protein, partial [Gammaproteobacteria bacterium]
MYAGYFGLSENPFAITPDPRYLFLSGRHTEALAHLLYGVTESGGFIQLTGEVGTGKTTLIRSLLEKLPDTVDAALIINPRVSIPEFLRAICHELHVGYTPEYSAQELIDALNANLLQAHARG